MFARQLQVQFDNGLDFSSTKLTTSKTNLGISEYIYFFNLDWQMYGLCNANESLHYVAAHISK